MQDTVKVAGTKSPRVRRSVQEKKNVPLFGEKRREGKGEESGRANHSMIGVNSSNGTGGRGVGTSKRKGSILLGVLGGKWLSRRTWTEGLL